MPLDGVGIRRADSADYAALIGLNAEPLLGAHWHIQWQERLLANDVFTYLVEAETIFGFVTAGPSLLMDADVGEVCGLFLSPLYRGSGMGKKLLVRGLSVLKRRGFGRAVIFVDSLYGNGSLLAGGAETTVRAESHALESLLVGLGFVPEMGEREINYRGATFRQVGHCLDLEGYF